MSPEEINKQYGAEIMRIWTASSDWANDLKIGREIIQTNVDAYRKLRNTLRYMIGALDGYDEVDAVDYAAMPALEKWVLHRLAEITAEHEKAVRDHDHFRKVPLDWLNSDAAAKMETVHNFRTLALETIEPLRREKVIKSSLEASVTAPAAKDLITALTALGITRQESYANPADPNDTLADYLIVSECTLSAKAGNILRVKAISRQGTLLRLRCLRNRALAID